MIVEPLSFHLYMYVCICTYTPLTLKEPQTADRKISGNTSH